MLSRHSAWTNYWQQDVLHSLPGTYPTNYEGTIRAFWQDAFASLSRDDSVLDIGTGNGAIPALVIDTCAASLPRMDAIDLSTVHPQWHARLPPEMGQRLHFHSGMGAESLDFPTHSFDLVTSQYGFEYADMPASVREISRVLKPCGRLALLMHHAQSQLSNVASDEVLHLDWLLRPEGLLHAARCIYPYLAQAATPAGRARLEIDPEAAAARQRFNELMRATTLRIGRSAFPDVLREAQAFIAAGLSSLQSDDPLEHVIARHEAHVRALGESRLRSHELCTHALNQKRMGQLLAQFEAHGFTILAHGPIHHENGLLMGWTLRAVAAAHQS